MRSIYAILLCAALCGCSMTNEEVIQETKKCRDAGFDVGMVRSGWTYRVVDIICLPRQADIIREP